MNQKTAIASIGCAAFAALLSGCNIGDSLSFAAEDKINGAFPLSEAVRNGKAGLFEMASKAQRKELEVQFNARLKIRALECAKGYSPSWYISADEVRKKLDNPSCFNEVDNGLARWIGIRRTGLVLAKPALRDAPASAPAFIVAEGSIQNARFATNAGIALLETSQAIEVVGFDTAKPIFHETRGANSIGHPSPNGRLFTVGEGNRLKIRETESGAALVELPGVRPYEFIWLDERTALYNKGDVSKAFIVDFVTGNEVPLQLISGGVQRATRVPGVENQYVLFSGRAATKIELLRGKVEPEVRLLAEKTISGIPWTFNAADATADGTRYFSTSRQLAFVSLESLEIETIALDPFYVQTGSATPDPDKIVFTGIVQPHQGEAPQDYMYSIGSRTLMPIERDKATSQRYLYIPSLRKQAVIKDGRIAILADLSTGEAIPLAKFTSDTLALANQRKLEAFERQQTQLGAATGYADGLRSLSPTPVPAPHISIVPGAPMTNGVPRDPRQSGMAGGTNSLIANLARDAQIEAVGVYQGGSGSTRTSEGRKMGYVEVRIRRTQKPIVLVLSSYEPVRWMLITEPGTKLSAVLVSGHYPSQVVGAGNARIVMTGNTYAYKVGGYEYQALSREIAKWTGKGIEIFQGRYEGETFIVGG